MVRRYYHFSSSSCLLLRMWYSPTIPGMIFCQPLYRHGHLIQAGFPPAFVSQLSAKSTTKQPSHWNGTWPLEVDPEMVHDGYNLMVQSGILPWIWSIIWPYITMVVQGHHDALKPTTTIQHYTTIWPWSAITYLGDYMWLLYQPLPTVLNHFQHLLATNPCFFAAPLWAQPYETRHDSAVRFLQILR